MDSCHRKHCETAISYSQALRLWCICLKEENFWKWTCELKKYFLRWVYSEQQVDLEIQWALDTSREACLLPQQNQDRSARTPLVVTYYHILPTFHSTTKCHLSILHTSERLGRVFPLPPLITFRRPRKLKDLLVRATLTSILYEPPGNHPCRASVYDLSNSAGHGRVFQLHCRRAV